MFGISPSELIVIIIVALLVLGPDKLPGVARTLGRLSAEMRRMSTEFQRTLHAEIEPEARPPAPSKSTPNGHSLGAMQKTAEGASGAQQTRPPAAAPEAANTAADAANAAPNLDHQQERQRA